MNERFGILVNRLRAYGYRLELDIEDDRGFRVEGVEVEIDGEIVTVAGKPGTWADAFGAISASIRA